MNENLDNNIRNNGEVVSGRMQTIRAEIISLIQEIYLAGRNDSENEIMQRILDKVNRPCTYEELVGLWKEALDLLNSKQVH